MFPDLSYGYQQVGSRGGNKTNGMGKQHKNINYALFLTPGICLSIISGLRGGIMSTRNNEESISYSKKPGLRTGIRGPSIIVPAARYT